MSVRRLFRAPVTIHHRADTGERDSYGDALVDETITETRGFLDRTSTATAAGETVGEAVTGVLFLAQDESIDAGDRVTVDGTSWAVVGEPKPVPTPSGGRSHLECVVQAVQ